MFIYSVTVVHSDPDDSSKHLFDIVPIRWYPESPIVKSQSTAVNSQFSNCVETTKSQLGVNQYNCDGMLAVVLY